jgi:predicted secreted acid phosphatase
MSLNATLKGIKEQFEQTAPAEIIKIMHDAKEQLRNSGIMETVLKVGDTVPDFTLPDTKKHVVSMASILANGPLVVTFFRGQW